jgi:hypothetical protein
MLCLRELLITHSLLGEGGNPLSSVKVINYLALRAARLTRGEENLSTGLV